MMSGDAMLLRCVPAPEHLVPLLHPEETAGCGAMLYSRDGSTWWRVRETTCVTPDRIEGRTVEAAAVLVGDTVYSMERPARHHDLVHALTWAGVMRGMHFKQGFLLDDGSWARRKPAFRVAEAAGQFLGTPIAPRMGELFSEDLW